MEISCVFKQVAYKIYNALLITPSCSYSKTNWITIGMFIYKLIYLCAELDRVKLTVKTTTFTSFL